MNKHVDNNSLSKKASDIPINEYYSVTSEQDNDYIIKLFDKNKKVIKEIVSPKEPYIKTYDNYVIQVTISTGNPASYTFLYNTRTNVISNTYFNLLLYDKEKITYIENSKLVVCNAFDKKALYREYEIDFAPTANPSSAVEDVKFEGQNKLVIKYLEGKDYFEKTKIIGLN